VAIRLSINEHLLHEPGGSAGIDCFIACREVLQNYTIPSGIELLGMVLDRLAIWQRDFNVDDFYGEGDRLHVWHGFPCVA
jgi:hypothetical protein